MGKSVSDGWEGGVRGVNWREVRLVMEVGEWGVKPKTKGKSLSSKLTLCDMYIRPLEFRHLYPLWES